MTLKNGSTKIKDRAKYSSGNQSWQNAPIHATLVMISVIWTLPSIGLLISSFRPQYDALETGWWTIVQNPFDFTQYQLGNYLEAIASRGMGTAFINSLTIAIPATVIPLAIASFAAFAFAWMKFPGRQTLFIIVVGLLIVPLQMTLIPVLRAYDSLGLLGTFLGIWLAHTAYGMPLTIYLLRHYIGTFPRDLIAVAAVDGASHLTLFTKLIIPLSWPAIASIAVCQFLWVWNDLLVALVYLGETSELAPMTLKLANAIGSRGQDWHILTASTSLAIIVPLIIFFVLQRYVLHELPLLLKVKSEENV